MNQATKQSETIVVGAHRRVVDEGDGRGRCLDCEAFTLIFELQRMACEPKQRKAGWC